MHSTDSMLLRATEMSSGKGSAMCRCVLAGCLLALASAGTVTRQSSSAWGTSVGGATIERGAQNSLSSGHVPDQSDLGLRSSFGSSRRRVRPTSRPQYDASQRRVRPTTGGQVDLERAPAPAAPALGAPAVGSPALGAPALGAPAVGSPVLGAPALGAPAVGAPAVGAPGLSVPSLAARPIQPLLSSHEIQSLVSQMVTQVFNNPSTLGGGVSSAPTRRVSHPSQHRDQDSRAHVSATSRQTDRPYRE